MPCLTPRIWPRAPFHAFRGAPPWTLQLVWGNRWHDRHRSSRLLPLPVSAGTVVETPSCTHSPPCLWFGTQTTSPVVASHTRSRAQPAAGTAASHTSSSFLQSVRLGTCSKRARRLRADVPCSISEDQRQRGVHLHGKQHWAPPCCGQAGDG